MCKLIRDIQSLNTRLEVFNKAVEDVNDFLLQEVKLSKDMEEHEKVMEFLDEFAERKRVELIKMQREFIRQK